MGCQGFPDTSICKEDRITMQLNSMIHEYLPMSALYEKFLFVYLRLLIASLEVRDLVLPKCSHLHFILNMSKEEKVR